MARQGEHWPAPTTPLEDTPPGTVEAAAGADQQTVDVNSPELIRPRTVGVESVTLWAMQWVGFTEMLLNLGLSAPLRSLIVGVIIGRHGPTRLGTRHPALAGTTQWGEWLEVDFAAMAENALYRASDSLMKHRTALENALFSRTRELFELDTRVTLYDLTNPYFEDEAASIPNAPRGHSMQKRAACPAA